MQVKGHWQKKVHFTVYELKVFDLNRQNIVILRYENARNTVEMLQQYCNHS